MSKPHSIAISSGRPCSTKKHYFAIFATPHETAPVDQYKDLNTVQTISVPVKDLLKGMQFGDNMNQQCWWVKVNIKGTKNKEVSLLHCHAGRSPTVTCEVVSVKHSDQGAVTSPLAGAKCELVDIALPLVKTENDETSSFWEITETHPVCYQFRMEGVFQFTEQATQDAALDMITCIQYLSTETHQMLKGCRTVEEVKQIVESQTPRSLETGQSTEGLVIHQHSIAFHILTRSIAATDQDWRSILSIDGSCKHGGDLFISREKYKELMMMPTFNLAMQDMTTMMSSAYFAMQHSFVKISMHGWVSQKVFPECKVEVQVCKSVNQTTSTDEMDTV